MEKDNLKEYLIVFIKLGDMMAFKDFIKELEFLCW